MPVPFSALTQAMSWAWRPRPAATSRRWASWREGFTWSHLVATIRCGRSTERSQSSIWWSSLVGPTSASTSTETMRRVLRPVR